jgi:hypothetical protein
MEASDPWIGVHVLTEFIFCPRAGVVAYEQRGEDQGVVELQGPALEYVPTLFELRDIEARLESELHRLGLYAAGLVCGLVLVSSLALFVDSGCWMLLLGLCGVAYPAMRCVVNVVKLSSQRKQVLGVARGSPCSVCEAPRVGPIGSTMSGWRRTAIC